MNLKLFKKSDIKWFLLALAIKVAYTILVSYVILPEKSEISSASPFGENLYLVFLIVVFLIPALETLIFQCAVIELMTQSSKSKRRKLMAEVGLNWLGRV